jgi:hypothetical protein
MTLTIPAASVSKITPAQKRLFFLYQQAPVFYS